VTLERPILALAVGLAAIAILFIIDRLRRRPVVLLVASLELFPESVKSASEAERTRRRAWLDLLLKGAAALALALAAGAPALANAGSTGRKLRVLLDRSASMEAQEAQGRRIDLARAELGRALDQLSPDDAVELHLDPPAADDPRDTLSPRAARAFAPRVLRVPRTLDDQSGLFALAASEKRLPLLVISDRPLAPIASEVAPWVAVALVGTRLENRGITALASRRDASGEKLLVATSAPCEVELTMSFTAGASEVRKLAVTGSAVAPVPSGVERAEARVLAKDALGSDDRAIAVRATDAPLRVAVEPGLGAPLETALRSVPGTDVHPRVEHARDDVTFMKWTDLEHANPPTGFHVYFAEGDEAVEGALDTLDPVFGKVAFPGVKAVRAEKPKSIETGNVVVDRSGHTLLGLGANVVWIGVAPPEPNDLWARSDDFPELMARILDHVRALAPEDLVTHPTGTPFMLPRPLDAPPGAQLLVKEPLGFERLSGPSYTPLEPGVHEVRREGSAKKVLFSAALLDPETQDLSQARTVPFSKALLDQLRPGGRTNAAFPLAWLLAILGLALGLAAWSLEER
jgi:hypothetical protein